jgi:hypothetical protein
MRGSRGSASLAAGRGRLGGAYSPLDAANKGTPLITCLFPATFMAGVGTIAMVFREEAEMLYILAVILLVAWLLGIVGTYTIGAMVHFLLVAAIVLFLIGLLSGRRTLV